MTKKTTNLSKDQTVREARVALSKKVIDNLNEARDPRRRDKFNILTGDPLSRNAGIAQRDESNRRARAEGRTGGPPGHEEAGRQKGAWSLKGRRGAKGPRGKPKPSSFPKGRDLAAEKKAANRTHNNQVKRSIAGAGGDASLFRKAGRKTGEFLNKVKGAASREGGYLKGAADQVKANARTGGQMIRKAVDKIPQTTVRGRSGPEGTTTPGRLSKFKSKLPKIGRAHV